MSLRRCYYDKDKNRDGPGEKQSTKVIILSTKRKREGGSRVWMPEREVGRRRSGGGLEGRMVSNPEDWKLGCLDA